MSENHDSSDQNSLLPALIAPKEEALAKAPGRSKRISGRRKAAYLQALEKYGSKGFAASVASPGCHARRVGQTSFQGLSKTDPAFAELERRALAKAMGRLESAAYQRALEGGDNTTLFRILTRWDKSWSERHISDVNATVVAVPDGSLLLSAEMILTLPPDLQLQAVRIIEYIHEKARMDRQGSA
jgi:hypothetical protein